MLSTVSDRILILDFGSQSTQLIARRIRECGVFSQIVDAEVSEETIRQVNPRGIILSGGPESVTTGVLKAPACVFTLGVPVLGICYGMQTMSAQLGGEVILSDKQEFGHRECVVSSFDGLFEHCDVSQGEPRLDVWMSHGDKVTHLPKGFKRMASSKNCSIAAIANDKNKKYGLQFHPEVTHTEKGSAILEAYIKDIWLERWGRILIMIWRPAKGE